MNIRPYLTPHQQEVLDYLRQLHQDDPPPGWVSFDRIGDWSALAHLVSEGYVERTVQPVGRGRKRYAYRPLDTPSDR